jgi:hypothetical protein
VSCSPRAVAIRLIINEGGSIVATLTSERVDALVRALAAARLKLNGWGNPMNRLERAVLATSTLSALAPLFAVAATIVGHAIGDRALTRSSRRS